MTSTCFCAIDPAIFKAKNSDWDEIFQIPGLTDVTLKGNDSHQTIHTCKILLASLGTKFEELLEQSTVELDFPFSVVTILHEFSLSKEFRCSETDIVPLLEVASQFDIEGIKMFGGKYLVSLVNAENVIRFHKLSQELLCFHFTDQIQSFMLTNFEDLGQKGDFLNKCNQELMELLIKNDRLNVGEENLISILLSWAKLSSKNAQDLAGLTNHIRFGLTGKEFFNAVVKSTDLLQKNTRIPNQFVIAVGGFGTEPVPTVEVWDIRANKWSTLNQPAFPSHAYHDMEILGTNIFVFGGFGDAGLALDYFVATFCLDLLTSTWTRKAAMPNNPRCFVSTALLNGEIFCMGGSDGITRFNTVEKYQPEVDQWTQVGSMHQVRSDACAVTYGNKIFVIGGFTGNEVISTTEIYDPILDRWNFGPSLTCPRSGVKAVIFNNKIYVIGGFNGHERLRSVETLDLLAPFYRWTLMSSQMNKPRSNFGVAVIDKKILVAGGFDGTGVIRDTETFSPETNSWTMSQEMNISRSALSLVTVSGLPNREDYLIHRQ